MRESLRHMFHDCHWRNGAQGDINQKELANDEAMFMGLLDEYAERVAAAKVAEAPGLLEHLTDQRVCEMAQEIAKLSRDTMGWTSHISWAIRRVIQAAQREPFSTYSCLVCGQTTPLPHVCPALRAPQHLKRGNTP